MKQASKLPFSSVHAHPGDGVKYLLFDNGDFIAAEVRNSGGFEQGLVQLADSLLRDRMPGVVLDIGANVGTFSLPLASRHEDSCFHCFEAQRIVAYQLCGAVALNGLPNVFVNQIAIGNSTGRIEITTPAYDIEPNVGAFSIDDEVNKLRGSTTLGQREQVDIRPIDSYGFSDVRLVKIDVEGMELAVLQGSIETLRRSSWPPLSRPCKTPATRMNTGFAGESRWRFPSISNPIGLDFWGASGWRRRIFSAAASTR